VTTRRRPPSGKTKYPPGTRPIYDRHGNVRAVQGRVELPKTVGEDGKPKRGQDTEDVPVGAGGVSAAIQEAEAWRAKRKDEIKHGFWNRPGADQPVLSYGIAYLERWYRHNPDTRDYFLRVLRSALVGHPLAARPLCEVRHEHVTDWLHDIQRDRHLKDSTLRARRKLLSRIFRRAVDDDVIGRNPVAGSWNPDKPPRRRVPVLTGEQVVRLALELPPHKRALVVVQAALGVRIGEVLGLRESDLIDVPAPSVCVESQLVEGRRRDVKTGEGGHRTIPLDPFAKTWLDEHMRKWPPLAHADPDYDGIIFYRRHNGVDGRHMRNRLRELRGAVERLHAADPTFPLLPKGVGTHVFRYHYGSEMAPLTGGDNSLIADMLGHADTAQLVNTYLRTRVGGDERVRAASMLRWGNAANRGESS
jgi:integrase